LALNLCASLCIVASPIIPNKVTSLWQEQLGLKGNPTAPDFWQNASKYNVLAGHKIGEVKPVFERLDNDRLEQIKQILSTPFDIAEYFKDKK